MRLADYTGDGKADATIYNKTTAAAYFGTGRAPETSISSRCSGALVMTGWSRKTSTATARSTSCFTIARPEPNTRASATVTRPSTTPTRCGGPAKCWAADRLATYRLRSGVCLPLARPGAFALTALLEAMRFDVGPSSAPGCGGRAKNIDASRVAPQRAIIEYAETDSTGGRVVLSRWCCVRHVVCSVDKPVAGEWRAD